MGIFDFIAHMAGLDKVGGNDHTPVPGEGNIDRNFTGGIHQINTGGTKWYWNGEEVDDPPIKIMTNNLGK
jgi:hypothetical protein